MSLLEHVLNAPVVVATLKNSINCSIVGTPDNRMDRSAGVEDLNALEMVENIIKVYLAALLSS